ncbi:MAG: copper chaperone PCu(A)C, partial [Pseudomonadota bacterium]
MSRRSSSSPPPSYSPSRRASRRASPPHARDYGGDGRISAAAPLVVAVLAAALAIAALSLTPKAPAAGPEAATASTTAPAANALATGPKLRLEKPLLPEMRPDEYRALRLVIVNDGAQADTLLGARAPLFKEVALFDRRGGPSGGLRIPAGSERALGPEGDGVLVIGAPKALWTETAPAQVILEFEKSGPVALDLRAGPRP